MHKMIDRLTGNASFKNRLLSEDKVSVQNIAMHLSLVNVFPVCDF